jgi:hypothetical protein
VKGKGTPEQHSSQLREDPWKKLTPFRMHLGDVYGKRIANLLGSNGRVAVSLALLGADVIVVDICHSYASRRIRSDSAMGLSARCAGRN